MAKREVALLRGVNVGGRTLSMAVLRDALEDVGCSDVITYIQSGNVVLTMPERVPADASAWLERLVSELAGHVVPVVLRTRADLQRTVAKNPYPRAAAKELHVVFFADPPPKKIVSGLELGKFAPEHCTLAGRDLYLRLPDGMGRAKLPVALDKAGRSFHPPAVGTARNWNTVLKLVDLLGG
jgi:uncharacterized protein (DUF1697 family)